MLLHNHLEYVSCACGYNAVNFLLLSHPFLLNLTPSPLGTSVQTSVHLPIKDGGVSARAKYACPAR